MKVLYDSKADPGIELKNTQHSELIEYLNLLSSCTTKEEVKQIELLYSDLSDYQFFNRYVPNIENKVFSVYKNSIHNILDTNLGQLKHIYGKEFEPISKNTFKLSNEPLKYSINNFFEDASKIRSAEEYEAFYMNNYHFQHGSFRYLSPTKISLHSTDSKLPLLIKENLPKDKAYLYRLAAINGLDVGFIPTPEQIKEKGFSYLSKCINNFSNSVNENYQQQVFANSEPEIEEEYYDTERVSEYEDNIPTNIPKIKSLLTKEEFTGGNLQLVTDLRNELLKDNCINVNDEVFLISKKQAEMLGTKINANSKSVALTIPPNEDVKDFHKEEYFHTSAVENQEIVNQLINKNFDSQTTDFPLQNDFTDEPYTEDLEQSLPIEAYNKLSFKEKHQYFLNNPYKPGVFVPSIGIRDESTGNINVLSGFTYSQTKDMEQTIVLSKLKPDGERLIVKIPATTYNTVIQNSLIITKAQNVNQEVKDRYYEAANLDQDKQRVNTAENFWHNYKAYCRVHCNNPQEAMAAAKHIISEMTPIEKARFKSQILNYQKLTNESYNDRILDFYSKAVDNKKIKDFSPFDKDALTPIKQFTEVDDIVGKKFDSSCKMKIGDSIKMQIEVEDVFKKSSLKLPSQELILISSCKDNNKVVLSDKTGLSKYVMNREEFIEKVQKLEKKQQKKENKLAKQESISYSL